ncbi:MAG: hypothetical protein IJQ16_01060 [Selenomonadaceae bacterium]|nr:hypothetical protein [Selenomonadaceae bacterium]
MTKDELRKIFDDAGKETLESLKLPDISQKFAEQMGMSQLSKEDGVKIGTFISLSIQLNQKFLFQVLSKVLCKPQQSY